MSLPTRNRAYCAFNYEDLPEVVGHVLDAYVSNVLMTEAEWRERVGATAPHLDMRDDKEWVMIDLGPWDSVKMVENKEEQ